MINLLLPQKASNLSNEKLVLLSSLNYVVCRSCVAAADALASAAASSPTPPKVDREPLDEEDEEIILTPPLKGKQRNTPTSLPLATKLATSSLLPKIKLPKEDAECMSEKNFTEETFDLTPRVKEEPSGAQGEEPREPSTEPEPKTKGRCFCTLPGDALLSFLTV